MSNLPVASEVLRLPAIAVRRLVIFPGIVAEAVFSKEHTIRTIRALQGSEGEPQIALLTYTDPGLDRLEGLKDVHPFACIASLSQIQKVPEGYRVSLMGLSRGKVSALSFSESGNSVEIRPLKDALETERNEARLRQAALLLRERFEELNELTELVPGDRFGEILKIEPDVSLFVDRLAYILPVEPESKMRLLGETSVLKRAVEALRLVELEIHQFQEVRSLHTKTKSRIERSQHQLFLREQLRAIQSQLEEGHEDEDDLSRLLSRIKRCKAPREVLVKMQDEAKKLARTPPSSPEYSLVVNYIESILELPWQKRTKLKNDPKIALSVLEAEHYGLEEVKESIIEMIAVQEFSKRPPRSILCLVGPPGVGKTSIAASIAHATGRVYRRIALGGLHDEAELRGHRRTYIGATMGRVISAIKSAKTSNPLILFDEVDKLGRDYKGDPAAAMLEILDPEQNKTFQDNFLEIPFDLSEVLFVCTANTISDIPEPLQDRMEIIRLPGYLGEEKLRIAKQHLLPKQLKLAGLKRTDLALSDKSLEFLIRGYTSEAGVRELERLIMRLCRKRARQKLEKTEASPRPSTPQDFEALLGSQKYHLESEGRFLKDAIGQVNALAWTRVGGEILRIEAVGVQDGKGELKHTGHLGEVMSESAAAAWTCLKSRLTSADVRKRMEHYNWHLHVLDAATPKDGPSAGCAIATALHSAVMKEKVRGDLAMTGELSLNGDVLPIGGLREKVYAAIQNHMKTVLFPVDNLPQWRELPPFLTEKIEGIACKTIDEIWAYAFVGRENFAKNLKKTKQKTKIR